MGIVEINPNLKVLAPQLPLPGYTDFIGSYLISGEGWAVVDPGPILLPIKA